MQLSDDEQAMLDGGQGVARRGAMAGLMQLGEAFGALDMVEIGYAPTSMPAGRSICTTSS